MTWITWPNFIQSPCTQLSVGLLMYLAMGHDPSKNYLTVPVVIVWWPALSLNVSSIDRQTACHCALSYRHASCYYPNNSACNHVASNFRCQCIALSTPYWLRHVTACARVYDMYQFTMFAQLNDRSTWQTVRTVNCAQEAQLLLEKPNLNTCTEQWTTSIVLDVGQSSLN